VFCPFSNSRGFKGSTVVQPSHAIRARLSFSIICSHVQRKGPVRPVQCSLAPALESARRKVGPAAAAALSAALLAIGPPQVSSSQRWREKLSEVTYSFFQASCCFSAIQLQFRTGSIELLKGGCTNDVSIKCNPWLAAIGGLRRLFWMGYVSL
jgi:hypothetical protein